MRASYVLGLAYLSGSHASVQPSPSVAADPTITAAPSIPIELLRQRQNNDRFMGWISASGEWTSRTCDVGGTFYQTDDVWRCCATTQAGCNVPVGCISGSLIYQYNTGSALSRSTIDWYVLFIYYLYCTNHHHAARMRMKMLRASRSATLGSCTKTRSTLGRRQMSFAARAP
jgi:hypothetical protein